MTGGLSRGALTRFERNQADTFFFSGPKLAEVVAGTWALDEFQIQVKPGLISGLMGPDWHLGELTHHAP